MRNYQLSKTDNQLTCEKLTIICLYIYIYIYIYINIYILYI